MSDHSQAKRTVPLGLRRWLAPPGASPGDWLFKGLALFCGLLLVATLVAMIGYLFDAARPAISRFGLGFLTSSAWDPVKDEFGALPAIFGTLLTSLVALAIAVPVSIAAAIFLAELAPRWLRVAGSFLVEMLAAVPSVVIGVWALFVMVPFIRAPVEAWLGDTLGFIPLFQGPRLGIGFLSGGIVLAVMSLPIITAITRDSILAVPNIQREAMLALGATRWETISKAVVPYARSGVIAAVILGFGRALGETMAVTMVIGNGYQITARLFAPGNTMASKIAGEFNEATSDLYIGSLVALGLVLFGITLVVNLAGRLLVKYTVAMPGGDER